MVSPPFNMKIFTGSVCVLLTSVSLKLIKIKIQLIYTTTSSWEKKNGGWRVSDADFMIRNDFFTIRVDPSPTFFACLAKMFVCPVPKISQVTMKWCRRASHLGRSTLWNNGHRRASHLGRFTLWSNGRRRASHLGRFTLWNNGRRATQLGRFTLWHYGRLATQLSRFTLRHNRRWASQLNLFCGTTDVNGRRAKQPGLMRAPGVALILQRKL